MTYLDYIEEQARRNVGFSLETLELLTKRSHTLLAMLLGGAGAASVLCLPWPYPVDCQILLPIGKRPVGIDS